MTSSNNSSQALNIAVVGAGIAGLTVAIALRRSGHLVQIFETSEIKTELGAALSVQTNAIRVLDHLGLSRDNLKGVTFAGNMIFSSETGEGTTHSWLVPTANENPGLLCHRSDLHDELKRLALGEGEGPPAKLRLGAKVLACDSEEGTITLNSGEVVPADVVLGADGISSTIRTEILGRVEKALPSGYSCFRAVFEPSNLRDMPDFEWLTAGISGPRMVAAKDGPFRMLIIYECRNRTLVNFVGFYTDSPGDAAIGNPIGTREEILDKFRDFHPKFLPLLDLPTHSPIHKWQLRVLPLLNTWIRGRAAILGDAAQATLPLLGQGAGIAIEEAGAIGCLLPFGTRREEIPARLKAYQDLRKRRGEFLNRQSVEQVSRIMEGSGFALSKEIQRQLFDYDTIQAAQECLQERFGHAS